jgi:hypothetical protein
VKVETDFCTLSASILAHILAHPWIQQYLGVAMNVITRKQTPGRRLTGRAPSYLDALAAFRVLVEKQAAARHRRLFTTPPDVYQVTLGGYKFDRVVSVSHDGAITPRYMVATDRGPKASSSDQTRTAQG